MIDPNIVYLLLLVGLWSGVTSAYVPGTGAVELVSAVVSVVAVLMLASMPTNWLAILLLIVGASGFLIMPFINRRLGLLAVGGLILQVLGSVFLFNGLSVSLPLIALVVLLSLLYHQFLLMPVLIRHHRQPNITEDDLLLGARGRVVTPINLSGSVYAAGEMWSARSERPLDVGDEVVVIEREGLVLVVEGLKHKRETQAIAHTEN